MKNSLFHSIAKVESLAVILLVVTVTLVVAYQTLSRELVINGKTANWETVCSDDRSHGGTSFTEDLSNSQAMSFSYTTQEDDGHSFAAFIISPPEGEIIDLDWFSEITVRARASGEGDQQFLFYVRDSPEHFVATGDGSSSKYNEAFIELTEQSNTISLPRDCFVVPRWWIAEKSVLPKDASPSFSNFKWIEIAVCRPNRANQGVVIIEEIIVRGPLMSPTNFYKLLFGIWSLLVLPLCIRFFSSTRKARAIRRIRLNQVAQQESASRVNIPTVTAKPKSCDTDEVNSFDELSELPTSFGLQDAIDEALHTVRSGIAKANIILIDIDDLERVNRTNGTSAGDAIIGQIAKIIEKTLPQGHKACRWCDDKFLILCQGQDRDESRILACSLRKCIDDETAVTCSFGVHQLNPINSFEEAYERAAKCVQEAKFQGKNKVVLFNLRSTSAPITHKLDPQLSQLPISNLV